MLQPPTIDEIRAARERLQGVVVRTPLIRPRGSRDGTRSARVRARIDV